MATSIPITNGRYLLGHDQKKALGRLGTVVQDSTGQWWELTEVKIWRNNPIAPDYTGHGKKVSAKYAVLSKRIEDLKVEWLAAKAASTFGPAAYDSEAGRPAREKMQQILDALDALDNARVSKVMPGVRVR